MDDDDCKDKLATAAMEQGGAQALAKEALVYLDAIGADNEELQVAAHLLHTAAKLAAHAALYRRLAKRDDDGGTETEEA